MGNTSSTNKPPKITNQDKAILQLKLQRDKLHKSQIKLQIIINKEKQIAKKCIKNNDFNKAKLTLRKKKHQETLLNSLLNQTDTLEQLINTIEFKLIEKDIIFGLEQGNNILKEINSEMNIEKIEKILDETEDGVKYQNDLSVKLGSILSNSEEIEVDEELAELENEMNGNVNVENNNTKIVENNNTDKNSHKLTNLPDVPNNKLEDKTQDNRLKDSQLNEEKETEIESPMLAT